MVESQHKSCSIDEEGCEMNDTDSDVVITILTMSNALDDALEYMESLL